MATGKQDSGVDVASGELTQLRAEVEELRAERQRCNDRSQFLQLLCRALLGQQSANPLGVCETTISLVTPFLEGAWGFAYLVDSGPEGLKPVVLKGVPHPEVLGSEQAKATFSWLLSEKAIRAVDRAQLHSRWPEPPTFLEDGFAVATVELEGRPAGILVVANRSLQTPRTESEIEFLTVVAEVTSLALARAHEVAVLQGAQSAREGTKKRTEIDSRQELIERQRSAIAELSTPILEVWENVLALPIIGVIDSMRSVDIMERLLTAITAKKARFVILDITGVEVVDTKTADHFIKVVKAAQLLGAHCILTGIRPPVAQTLVDLGVELTSIHTLRTLRDGLKACLRRMGASARSQRPLDTFVEASDVGNEPHSDHQAVR